MAAEIGDCDIINTLLKRHANIHALVKDYIIPLYVSCNYGHFNAVKLLLKAHLKLPLAKDEKSEINRAITYAILGQNLFIIQLLFKHGANLYRKTDHEGSYLHIAAQAGGPEVLEYFINLGLDINLQNSFKQTPLHLACYHGNEGAVKLLLDLQADTNLKEIFWEATPLELAIIKNHETIVNIFICHSNCSLSNETKECTLQCAIEENNFKICQSLLEYQILVTSNHFKTAIAQFDYNKTENLDIVNLLIKFGAYNQTSKLPQHYMNFIIKKFPYLPEIAPLFAKTKLGDFSLFGKCLAKGFDINTRDENYETVLHHAVRSRNKTVVQKLLCLGADPTAASKDCRNAVQLAADLGFLDVLGIFTHAAMPMSTAAPKFLNVLKNITEKIEKHVTKIKDFKNKKTQSTTLAKCIGILAGAIVGCSLGAYTLLKGYRTYKSSGLRQAFKAHWLKGLGSIAAGGLAYFAASKLTWAFKRKPLLSLKQKLDSEKDLIAQSLAKLRGSIDQVSQKKHKN